MKLTPDFIRQQHTSWLEEEKIIAGENLSFESISLINEKLRALYILQTTEGNMKPNSAFSLYMVRPDVAIEILENFSTNEEALDTEKTKRKDKYSAISSWCKENVLMQVNPKQISEIGNVSYPTALKYINDHPDIFWKISRGTYEVRDPVADRAAEKK